jgi:hypothetical protein
MSAVNTGRKPARRRFLVRVGLIAVYVLAIALAFVTGKGHTILVDNKDRPEGFAALDGILVSVDGKEPLELYAGDRDMVKVKGQRHRVSIEAIAGGDKKEITLELPMGEDMLLLSVPKLAAGREDCLEPFVQKDQPAAHNEPVGNTNEFTSPGGTVEPQAQVEPPAP